MRTNRIREKYTPYILLPMMAAMFGANTVNKLLTAISIDRSQMALAALLLTVLGCMVFLKETGGLDWNYRLTRSNFWGVFVGVSVGVGGFTVFHRELLSSIA